MDKIDSLVKQMRWRAFYYLSQQKFNDSIIKIFGFK